MTGDQKEDRLVKKLKEKREERKRRKKAKKCDEERPRK